MGELRVDLIVLDRFQRRWIRGPCSHPIAEPTTSRICFRGTIDGYIEFVRASRGEMELCAE